MTNEEKMVWAAVFAAEYVRLFATDLLEVYKVADKARDVACEAVRSMRLMGLDHNDWQKNNEMTSAMTGAVE